MNNNDDNRFQFIDLDDVLENDVKEKIQIIPSPEQTSVTEHSDEDNYTDSNEEIPQEKINVSKKIYFSFEKRIIVAVVLILCLFVGACILALKVINHTSLVKTSYNEEGNVTYQVCMKDSVCLDENNTYDAKNVSVIKLVFNYDIISNRKVKLNESYYVTVTLRSYDSTRTNLLYEEENELIERIKWSDKESNGFSKIVTIDYDKYNSLIDKYVSGESIDEMEVALYIDDSNKSRKVSSAIIPLSVDSFEISKNTLSNSNREMEVLVNVWDSYSIVYAISSSILVIISLILIYRTTRLVLRVATNKNIYQNTVDNILKEYDSIIVVARDGYESLGDKNIIKLNSFNELLDIKDDLNKPIVFSKINDVKCEFIVENDDNLYKYVIKEADFINEK